MPGHTGRGSVSRRCRPPPRAEDVERSSRRMTVTAPSKRLTRWIPGVTVGAWALAVLWLGTDAGYSIPAFLVAEMGGLLLLGWWLARVVWWWARRRRSPGREPLARGLFLRRLWEPLTIVTCGMIAFTGIGFPARFAMSRPALDRYVQELRARGDSTPPAGHVVGLFRLREVEVLPGGVVRLITTSCMMDNCGIAYSLNGPPPVIGEDSYRHLSGNWWHWFRSW